MTNGRQGQLTYRDALPRLAVRSTKVSYPVVGACVFHRILLLPSGTAGSALLPGMALQAHDGDQGMLHSLYL